MSEPTPASSSSPPLVSAREAAAVVVGNMIGIGVFTSLGFQLVEIRSGFVLLALWVLGGVFALCGALSYAELAAALPRSGGEYHYLSRIYHPLAGFLSGWVAALVGFAAPVALMAMAFGRYLGEVVALPGLGVGDEVWLPYAVVVLVTAAHLWRVEFGGRFQFWSTVLKLGLILAFIVAAFVQGKGQPVSFAPREGDFELILSAPFAISLVYVMYSYEGWNAATYIAGEVRDPRRSVPLALVGGTLLVTLVYVAINAAFLLRAPMEAMAGTLEVGLVAGREIFGDRGGEMMALLVAGGLVSSISAMMWAGPRVAMAMGEDYALLRALARRTARGVPVVAILLQTALVGVLLVSASFSAVLVYLQFILLVSSFFTVAGVVVLRITRPNLDRPFRTPLYPLTPLVFLSMSASMMVHIAREKPVESSWGVVTLLAGVVVYVVARRGRCIIPRPR